MKVLVLGGGLSSERDVSLRSSAAVADALTQLGHDVQFLDAQAGDAAIRQAAAGADVVFPILHGAGGEDGVMQRLLDAAGRPYLGSGAAASALCFNKDRLLELAVQHGITTPAGAVVDAKGFAASPLKDRPFVLKPVADGSTVGCLIARQLPYDRTKVSTLFAQYSHMLLEELVEGVEITVPVLGETALPVIEIIPPSGQEFDYENKYNGAASELCPPQHVSAADQQRAQRLAEQVHRLAGCRHLSRTDMIIRPNGELVVLEINTMPGMTSQSLYPKSAATAGFAWAELVARLLKLATA